MSETPSPATSNHDSSICRYGEPWHRCPISGGIIDRHGKPVNTPQQYQRVLDSVNACASIIDPESIHKLFEAIEALEKKAALIRECEGRFKHVSPFIIQAGIVCGHIHAIRDSFKAICQEGLDAARGEAK